MEGRTPTDEPAERTLALPVGDMAPQDVVTTSPDANVGEGVDELESENVGSVVANAVRGMAALFPRSNTNPSASTTRGNAFQEPRLGAAAMLAVALDESTGYRHRHHLQSVILVRGRSTMTDPACHGGVVDH